MRECDLGEGKILLVKDNGHFTAVGSKCSHYGAPLKNGAYINGRIRCPWHGACFHSTTGDIEDYPGVGGIASFNVRVEGTNVIVSAPAAQLTSGKSDKHFAKRVDSDARVFVIIGGGAAGSTAAETLRGSGYTGRIILVNREKHVAYDRPKLSKVMDIEVSKILLRPASFYDELGIEMHLGVECTELDSEAKTVKLSTGDVIKYDQALIATGADSQKLPFIPGHDGKNVFTLRNPEEAHTIVQSVQDKHVVIVGSSFIGMEVASCIVKKAKSTIVIGMEQAPFERVLGLHVGQIMQKLHESQGVKFHLNAVVKEFKKGADGLVSGIILKDDTQIDADIFVVGAGVIPTTSFVKESPLLKRERDRSIIVDKFLHTGADGLYAAGDLARFPYPSLDNELIRIEHWGFAQTQGMIAAKNMAAGKPTHVVTNIPFFWTTQYGKSVRYAGHGIRYETVLLDTEKLEIDPANPKFVAYYIHNDKVVAVSSMNRDPVVAEVAELLQEGVTLSSADLKTALDQFGHTSTFIKEKSAGRRIKL